MIESDDVGGAVMAQELAVNLRHLRIIDQVQAQLIILDGEIHLDQASRDAAEQRNIDRAHALSTANAKQTRHAIRRHAAGRQPQAKIRLAGCAFILLPRDELRRQR